MSATPTPHYALLKPDPLDQYDVSVFNGNADLVDAALFAQANGIAALEQQFKYKAADQLSTNTTTFADDVDLFVPVVSGAVYMFEAVLFLASATSSLNDIQFRFTFPGSSTLYFGPIGHNNADLTTGSAAQLEGIARTNTGSPSSSIPLGLSSSALPSGLTMGTLKGMLICGAAGNLKLQFAQLVAGATSSAIKAGSHMLVRKVG